MGFFEVNDVFIHSVDESLVVDGVFSIFVDFRISSVTAAGRVEFSFAVTLPLLFVSAKR